MMMRKTKTSMTPNQITRWSASPTSTEKKAPARDIEGQRRRGNLWGEFDDENETIEYLKQKSTPEKTHPVAKLKREMLPKSWAKFLSFQRLLTLTSGSSNVN